MLLPVDHPGQEQKATWLQVRKEKPDYVLMWGWGVMNQVAIKEAAAIRYPMDHFIGIWWSGSEADVGPAGEAAHDYKAAALNKPGTEFPLFDDIKKYVVDPGKAAGDGSHVGEVLYNRGVYTAMIAVEAAGKAQEIHGVKDITPAMMRDGLEALKIDAARLAELGLPDFAPQINVTCANHGGPGVAAIQQWDAHTKVWSIITPFSGADRELVDGLIAEDSTAYAAENNITPRDCN
jgi:branched-chain amino acid transport system substrate-binding protein